LKPRSLRVRFAVWTALVILSVLAVFGATVYFRMEHDLSAALDSSLRVSASQIVASLNIENGQLQLPDSLAEQPNGGSIPSGFRARILAPDGQVLRQSGEPIPQPPAALGSSTSASYSTAGEPPLRIYTALVTDSGHPVAIVQVAQPTAPVQDTLDTLLAILLVAAPLLVIAAGLGGYLLAAKALQPVDAMTQMARRISAEDLTARLDLPQTEDEVGRLAATLDSMLERLEASFRRERQFTSNASHELRTPLAAMQTIIGVTRQKRRTPPEYEQALDDLTEETNRLRGLVEALLRLARSDTEVLDRTERIDITTLLEDIVESMRPMAEGKNLQLSSMLEKDMSLFGQQDELIRLFVNLLDNAIKYTPSGTIEVRATKEDGLLRIDVEDTGIGIPAEDLQHVFERFYRVGPSRSTEGSGLGLALAQQIVEAYGGTISTESQERNGTTMTVLLPERRH